MIFWIKCLHSHGRGHIIVNHHQTPKNQIFNKCCYQHQVHYFDRDSFQCTNSSPERWSNPCQLAQQTMDPQRIKLCQAFSELKFHDGGMAKLDTMAFTIAQLRKQLEEINEKTGRLRIDSTVSGAGLFWQGFEAHGEWEQPWHNQRKWKQRPHLWGVSWLGHFYWCWQKRVMKVWKVGIWFDLTSICQLDTGAGCSPKIYISDHKIFSFRY